MHSTLLFCFSVLAILATPGPTNTLLAISGASAGFRRSLPLVPAELIGYVTAILAIGLAVGPVLAATGLFLAFRIAAVAYLIYLSVRLWRFPPLDVAVQRVIKPRDVLVTTLLNPKALIFALVILPMQDAVWPRYLLGFCAILVPVSLLWILAGAGLKRSVIPAGGTRIAFRVGAAAVMGFAAVVFWPVLTVAWPR